MSYKNYRNIFNSLIRASKQKQLDENFRKYSKNPKKMWDILKETTFGENVKQGITEINVNGATLSDPGVIAEEFNNFFT